MHILAIVWHPNTRWDALEDADKLAYLKSLDDYINDGDQLIALNDELQTVRWMRQQRQKGHTLRQIAGTLNTRKVPTKNGRTWYASTIRHILENSLYQSAA